MSQSKYLVPPVNLKGRFKIRPPYNTAVNEHIVYTVTAVRTIRELINNDINVYNIIYRPFLIPREVYNKHLEENVPIVVLSSQGNREVHIPAPYIESIPSYSGVPYVQMALVVDLGFLPKDVEFNVLANDIKELVLARTGIEAKIKVSKLTNEFIVDYEEHDRRKKERMAKVTLKTTCMKVLEELIAKHEAMKERMRLLVDKLVKLENRDKGG